ncbi:MAG: hypothetical protein QGG42_01430 [Phycisphaerae bacterium]|jgi:hypothetical protein|nr:hypothetical protein [Phycisphaerae bacterium]
MVDPKSNKQSQADALGQLASHAADATTSVPDLVAAAKAPTTAKGAAVASASQPDQPKPPQTVGEARARSQRGLELLTNVISVLENASKTVSLSGKHTRSAIDNTFKLAYAKLAAAAENVQRSSDSIASTNNRMAAALKALSAGGAAGTDPADLAQIKEQLAAIRDGLANSPEPVGGPDFQEFKESLQELKTAVENAPAGSDDGTAHAAAEIAKDVKELTKVVEGRTGKLTTLVVLALACSIFAALCAFAGILTMLLTQSR